MTNHLPFKPSFDIQHWLRKAGRRTAGLLLLAASIGFSSVQAWHAVDSTVMPLIERSFSQITESSS